MVKWPTLISYSIKKNATQNNPVYDYTLCGYPASLTLMIFNYTAVTEENDQSTNSTSGKLLHWKCYCGT